MRRDRLFLFSRTCVEGGLLLPNNFSVLITRFLIRFFVHPCIKTLIATILLANIKIYATNVIGQVTPISKLFVLCILPVLTLLFVRFSFGCEMRNAIYCLVVVTLLYKCVEVQGSLFHLITNYILIPILF